MEFGLALLFLTIGSACALIHNEDCGSKGLQYCYQQLKNVKVLETVYPAKDLCKLRVEVRECFQKYSERCVLHTEPATYPEDLDEKIRTTCTSYSENKEVAEALECLQDAEDHLDSCTKGVLAIVISKALTRNVLGVHTTKSEVQCMTFRMLIDCFIGRVNEHCAAKIAEVVKTGIERETRDIREACMKGEDIEHLLATHRK